MNKKRAIIFVILAVILFVAGIAFWVGFERRRSASVDAEAIMIRYSDEDIVSAQEAIVTEKDVITFSQEDIMKAANKQMEQRDPELFPQPDN